YLPPPGGLALGLSGQGTGVLLERRRFGLGFGPFRPEALRGGGQRRPARPVRVEGLVARRLPAPGLLHGGPGPDQGGGGRVTVAGGVGRPAVRLFGGGRGGSDG